MASTTNVWKARSAALAGAAMSHAAGLMRNWDTQANYMLTRPTNEWSFVNMNTYFPSATVRRGAHTEPLPERAAAMDWRGLADFHERTFTTAFLVLHRGALVHESYPGLFAGRERRFQLFSLSKSVLSLLVGAAVQSGLLHDLADPVIRYLPGLKGSAYEGPTVDDLLTMSSGVGGAEDWSDPASSINQFSGTIFAGGSLHDMARSATRAAAPGTTFNYSTLDAQVLGWVVEAATGCTLAEYASRALWSRIGADRDAYYWLTRSRPHTAVGAASLNATARDVARLGLLMSRHGRVGDARVLPADWIPRCRGAAAPHLAVGALGPSGRPHYGYANLWWTLGGEHEAFTGIGIYGQYLYVDPAADVVIVKLSAWPRPDDDDLDRETIGAFEALVRGFDTTDREDGR
ncbi:serine hydrolase [Actinoplanes sp. NPDC023714]|uniref:serine hydrolase domain-containing protein n=1 Tax=Actinoplanes sp. NPDC023714 TaxID=3154322 RepID=UPI0033DD344A